MATRPLYRYMFLILDASDEAHKTKEALRVLSEDIHVFTDKKSLDDFIDGLKEETKTIVLITSGSLGIQLKTDLTKGEKYAKIQMIYIYCHSAAAHKRWSSEIDKIKGVHTTHDELLAALGYQKPTSEQPAPVLAAETSPTTTTTAATTTTVTAITVTTSPTAIPNEQVPDAVRTERKQFQTKFLFGFELNSMYHIFRTLLEHYVHIPPQPNEKDMFSTLLGTLSSDDSSIDKVLADFQQYYSNDQPMNCLQRHQRFSTALSRPFIAADPFSLIACVSLFRDLLQQFRKCPPVTSQRWYCCQMCSRREVNQIEAHKGQYATLLSFASATNNQDVAKAQPITRTETDRDIRVLFSIQTDPHGTDALPFAQLNDLLPNCDQKTDEVVFMVGSFFHIDRVETTNNLVTVHLTLCAYENDGPNRQLCEQYRQMYVVNNNCNLVLFSCLLFQLGVKLSNEDYTSSAETLISIYSGNASEGNTEVLNGQVLINSYSKEWDETITTCETTIDLWQKQNRPLDRALVDVYQHLAKACVEKGRNDDSLKHARAGVSILRKISEDDNDFQVLPFCHTMALAHERGGNSSKAVASCYRALSIAIQDGVYLQQELCWIYDTLAKLETKNEQYQLAAGFYEKLLEIRKKTDSDSSAMVGDICIHLGKLHHEMKSGRKAEGYFRKALEIFKAIEPPGSIKLMEIEVDIERCEDLIQMGSP